MKTITPLALQGRFLVRDLCMLLRFRSSADPSDPGLELEVDRMCLALDSFESTSEYAWRLALSVADIKVVTCFS